MEKGTREMNNEPVAWKAYEEINFSDQYILRWVREGDEYVNRITKEMMEDFKSVVRQQQAEIEALNQRIERMIEKQSHYEAMAHAGGFEAGRQQGMKQERALWELAASTQELEKDFFDRAREVAKQIDNNEYHTPED